MTTMKRTFSLLALLTALAIPALGLAAGPVLLAQAPYQQNQYQQTPSQQKPSQQKPYQQQPAQQKPSKHHQGYNTPYQQTPYQQQPAQQKPSKHHQGYNTPYQQPKGQYPYKGPHGVPSPTVVKPGAPVVAPPGSVVVPPAAVTPPPGRSSRAQANAIAHCNQKQASCTNRCNYGTYGQARNMCYNQCNAQFVNCTARANRR